MSPGRREISTPRTDGTMQKVHVLLQPTWTVTHAEWCSSRLTGREEGIACNSSTTSVIGPQFSA
jgi:hypothetical protein